MAHKPLTPMQYTFCSTYIKNGFNAYQAAVHAGYSEKYALTQTKKLITNPLVKERITQAFAKVDDKLGVAFEWRVSKLKRIVNAIVPDDEHEEIKLVHGKVAIQALAEINKMYGDYAPEKRLNMTVNATLDKLTEARKAYEEY